MIFAAMAAIPVICINYNGSVSAKSDKEKSVNADKNNVCNAAYAFCDNKYSDETIGLIIKIVYTNITGGYTYSKTEISDKELYKRIETLFNSNLELLHTKNSSQIFIPISKGSGGMTVKSKEKRYLSPVASPWDCFKANYKSNINCEGVSADGIDYLCSNGFTANEALKWYLPEAVDFN